LTIPIAIFGGPGSGAVVAQSLRALATAQGGVRVLGFLNDVLPAGERVSDVPVIGPFASWATLAEDVRFVAPLHQVKAMPARAEIVAALGIPVHRWTTVIDPMSAVAPDATIGHGCFIGPFASVGPGVRLGAHTVVRAGAHVGHDCRLGDFVFILAGLRPRRKTYSGTPTAPSFSIRRSPTTSFRCATWPPIPTRSASQP